MKEITIQFSQVIDATAQEIREELPRRFHDVERAEINFDPREKGIKTIILHCNRCSPDDVLNFLKNFEKSTMKGCEMAEQTNSEQANVDINKTCNDLAKGFQAIFGTTGNLSENLGNISNSIKTLNEIVTEQGLQILAIEQLINGTPAKVETKTPAKPGLKDMIETIRQDSAKTVVAAKSELEKRVTGEIEKLSKKEAQIDSLEKSCAAIEKHLRELPLFKGALKDDKSGKQPTKPRPLGT